MGESKSSSTITVIINGHVIDPANGVNGKRDVLIVDGKFATVGPPGSVQQSMPRSFTQVFDAEGCIVTPGLIDLHVHCYEHVTPLGMNVDKYSIGRGVTTVVDAGSAGSSTLPGLRKFIAERSRTRVLAFVNISLHGMASAGCTGFGQGGELDSLKQVNTEGCIEALRNNRDIAVGVKLRLDSDAADGGKNEEEAYRRALEARHTADVPLMVHYARSTVPMASQKDADLVFPGNLRPGDIYTHMMHAHKSTMIANSETLEIHPSVIEARRRGILFDIGHGQGSFSWTVAEAAAAAKFWPDTISTDLHTGSCEGPAYDLVTVMTKMLHVGMPMEDIIRAVTFTPAKAIRWEDRIGSMTTGCEADITVLRVQPVDVLLEDCQAQTRRIKERIVPVAVWKSGEPIGLLAQTHAQWPNEEHWELLSRVWPTLVVRDKHPPSAMKPDEDEAAEPTAKRVKTLTCA